MKQSRFMSLVEAVANVIVGYGVAVATQILIFPIFGLHTTLAQNLKMGAVFTLVSLALERVEVVLRLAADVRGDPCCVGKEKSAIACNQAVWLRCCRYLIQIVWFRKFDS